MGRKLLDLEMVQVGGLTYLEKVGSGRAGKGR
jgi:hypothetical protein